MARFDRLAKTLRSLAEVPSRAAAQASRDIAGLVQAEFDAGQDAYGNAWAPLKEATLAKGRQPPPLTDTGFMRDTIDVHPARGAGIQIDVEAPYAGFHQDGWRDGPARPILPDHATLPPSWSAAIQSSVDDAFKRRMR